MAKQKENASISAAKAKRLIMFRLPFFAQHAVVSEMTQPWDQLGLHGGVAGKMLAKTT